MSGVGSQSLFVSARFALNANRSPEVDRSSLFFKHLSRLVAVGPETGGRERERQGNRDREKESEREGGRDRTREGDSERERERMREREKNEREA